jgi:uncharacterized protein YdeI (YjbR/CyaY-like superfamily)
MSNNIRNPKIDSYTENAEEFATSILAHLRELIHATCRGFIEEMKWGIPHFDYKGEMMCIFAAYKKHCSFSFWKDALTRDKRIDEALSWITEGKGRSGNMPREAEPGLSGLPALAAALICHPRRLT